MSLSDNPADNFGCWLQFIVEWGVLPWNNTYFFVSSDYERKVLTREKRGAREIASFTIRP